MAPSSGNWHYWDVPSPRHLYVRFDAPDFAAIALDRARYKTADLSPHTISSYSADVRVFEAWCDAGRLAALPASEETLEIYVTDLLRRGRKVTTVERHCFAIQRKHRLSGHPSPYAEGVRKLLGGARRILAQMPEQKTAIEPRDIRAIVRKVGIRTPIRARNCALLVFGFATALRRSSLARLRPQDVQFTRDGMLISVRYEKQDRRGEGRKIAVPFGRRAMTCPVRLLRHWIKMRGNRPGALFCRVMRGHPNGKQLLGNRIGQIVQELVAAVGLERRLYAAHSMRAGFATTALGNGASEIMVARQTGHASLDTLRLYERSRDLFRGNAAGSLGL